MDETLKDWTDDRDVRAVLAHYVRATDARDGAAMAALFVPDGRVTIEQRGAAGLEPLGELVGAEAIGGAVATMMPPHSPGAWSHHVTADLIVAVDGNRATIDAQFVMFRVLPGPDGSMVTPREAGYYRPELVRTPDGWRIARMAIALNTPPYAEPPA